MPKGLRWGEIDTTFWERQGFACDDDCDVILRTLCELFIVCAMRSVFSLVSSRRTRQYMADVDWSGKPLLYLPASLAREIASQEACPPGHAGSLQKASDLRKVLSREFLKLRLDGDTLQLWQYAWKTDAVTAARMIIG